MSVEALAVRRSTPMEIELDVRVDEFDVRDPDSLQDFKCELAVMLASVAQCACPDDWCLPEHVEHCMQRPRTRDELDDDSDDDAATWVRVFGDITAWPVVVPMTYRLTHEGGTQ